MTGKFSASNVALAVKGASVALLTLDGEDYISITDIARFKDARRTDHVLQNWLRNRNTVEFLGIWEQINNPEFKPLEFEGFRNQAGLNSFVLTARQWIEATGAIGLLSRRGRTGGGTFAHRDIAFEFASWISVEFKLYLIKEFQRLKVEESRRLSTAWDLNRTLSKLNYRIHTDAVRTIIPPQVTPAQAARTYASEADMLNVALFGQTAKQWRDANPDGEGNMRDHASIQQLLVLANLESLNAELIQMGLQQGERLQKLNAAAIRQMRLLTKSPEVERLEGSRRSKPPQTAECRSRWFRSRRARGRVAAYRRGASARRSNLTSARRRF